MVITITIPTIKIDKSKVALVLATYSSVVATVNFHTGNQTFRDYIESVTALLGNGKTPVENKTPNYSPGIPNTVTPSKTDCGFNTGSVLTTVKVEKPKPVKTKKPLSHQKIDKTLKIELVNDGAKSTNDKNEIESCGHVVTLANQVDENLALVSIEVSSKEYFSMSSCSQVFPVTSFNHDDLNVVYISKM